MLSFYFSTILDCAIDWDRKSSILVIRRWIRWCTTKPAFRTCASARPNIVIVSPSWHMRTSASGSAFSYRTGESLRDVEQFGISWRIRRISLAADLINRALYPPPCPAFKNSNSRDMQRNSHVSMKLPVHFVRM